MNRQAFFDGIRPHFGGQLSAAQVAGMNSLLDAGAGLPLHHMAHILANVRRETGGYMGPIKETVMPHHKDKLPSDAEVIRRLDRAYKAGKLPWVTSPYWRDGWFGRGQIQITHKSNYAKFGISNPDDALRPHISAHIAVKGMTEGLFTGKKLSDYNFPADLSNPPSGHPRRIVNGPDGSEAEVSRYHGEFAKALSGAQWGAKPADPLTRPAPQVNETPKSEHVAPEIKLIPVLLAAIAAGAASLWGFIQGWFQ